MFAPAEKKHNHTMLRFIKEVFLKWLDLKWVERSCCFVFCFFCFLGNEKWSQPERINNKSLQNKSDPRTKYTNIIITNILIQGTRSFTGHYITKWEFLWSFQLHNQVHALIHIQISTIDINIQCFFSVSIGVYVCETAAIRRWWWRD